MLTNEADSHGTDRLYGDSLGIVAVVFIFLREVGVGGGNAVELRMEEIRVEEEPVSPPITDT